MLIVESGYTAHLNYIKVGTKYVPSIEEAISQGLTGKYIFNFTIIDNATGIGYVKPDGQVDIVNARLIVTQSDAISESVSESVS